MLKLISNLALITVSTCLYVHAQAEETSSPITHQGSWYVGGGYIGLDSEATDPQGIGSGGFTIDMGYSGSLSNGFMYNLGLYMPFFSDDEKFTQRVEDQFGDRKTEDSSITSWGILAEAGYRFTLNEKTSFGLSAGFRSLSADREIANCTNCYSEGLDLEGGAYLRPALFFNNPTIDVEIAAMTFFTGDMTNGVMLNFHF